MHAPLPIAFGDGAAPRDVAGTGGVAAAGDCGLARPPLWRYRRWGASWEAGLA